MAALAICHLEACPTDTDTAMKATTKLHSTVAFKLTSLGRALIRLVWVSDSRAVS